MSGSNTPAHAVGDQPAGPWTVPGAVMTLPSGELRLRGGKCTECGAEAFPRQPVCRQCWSEAIADEPLPATGTLYAFTIVHVARKGWRTPYAIAYVDLDNGVRVSAPLACDIAHPPAYDSRVRLAVGEIGRADDGRPIMSHRFEVAQDFACATSVPDAGVAPHALGGRRATGVSPSATGQHALGGRRATGVSLSANRKVAIIGAAMSRFGRYPNKSIQDLGWPVVKAAVRDAGIAPSAIEAAYAGSAYGGRLVGQRVLRPLGLLGLPVVNCENACSSGGTAFREAWQAIGHGEWDCALVIGIDKLTALGGGVLPGQPDDWDVSVGLTMPALYAMRAGRYLHEHKVTPEQLAQVAVKAHRHGALNPYAQYQNEVTLTDVATARPIADPFTLLHCCPTGDGAAALVLASERKVRELGIRAPVWVAASELNSGRYMTGYRDMTSPEITVRGAAEVWEMSGMGPQDIDVAEVHDAFTIAELLYYEAFGFCQRGEAIALLESGATSLGGRIPVNPSGGLLCKGHPVGATGAAQLVELTWQLRGEAGRRQVEGARTALAHCTGGGIAGLDHGACSINILSR